MELRPAIAGHSGQSYRAIRSLLDARALHAVARVSRSPVRREELDASLREGLIEMHVLREEKGRIRLDSLRDLLKSTTCGRRGVPTQNMMLNLWRYLRRALAKTLYAKGFFTDRAPETGVIAIFYENNVELLDRLLS
jgi:hypothetical protein